MQFNPMELLTNPNKFKAMAELAGKTIQAARDLTIAVDNFNVNAEAVNYNEMIAANKKLKDLMSQLPVDLPK